MKLTMTIDEALSVLKEAIDEEIRSSTTWVDIVAAQIIHDDDVDALFVFDPEAYLEVDGKKTSIGRTFSLSDILQEGLDIHANSDHELVDQLDAEKYVAHIETIALDLRAKLSAGRSQ